IINLKKIKFLAKLLKIWSCYRNLPLKKRFLIHKELKSPPNYFAPDVWTNPLNHSHCFILAPTNIAICLYLLPYEPAKGMDLLTFKNGPKGATIGIFYGQDLPKAFITSSNQLYLFFKSNSMNTDIGFMIKWKTFDAVLQSTCIAFRVIPSQI
ncbi:unnamed protein product, partial [Meganyctiphanes norvegica]